MKQTEIPDRIDKATGTDTPAPLLDPACSAGRIFRPFWQSMARARAFMKAHGNPRQWNDIWAAGNTSAGGHPAGTDVRGCGGG